MLHLAIIVIGIAVVLAIFMYAAWKDRRYRKRVEAEIDKVRHAIQKAAGHVSSTDGNSALVLGEHLSLQEWEFMAQHLHGETSYVDGNGQERRMAFWPKTSVGRLLRTDHPLRGLARQAHAESPVRWAIGLCIVVGVAGTFSGITVGLYGADTASVEGTQQLINGMKASFFTSLMGMAAAALLTIWTARSKSKRQAKLEEARTQIDKCTLPMSAAQLLGQSDPRQAKRAADASMDAARELSQTATALQRSVGELAGAASSLSADAIGESVGQSVRGAIDDQLKPVFQEIRNELEVLREIKADQGQKVLKLLIEQMRDEVLTPMSAQLQQSAELTTQAVQSVDALRGVVEDAVSHMRDDLQSIRAFQDDTLSQMRAFAGELQQRVEAVMDSSLASVQDVARDVAGMVDDGKTAMEAQRQAFDLSTERAKEAFADVGDRLGHALSAHTEEAEAMFDRVATNVVSLQERFERAFAEQNGTLKTIGEEASRTMREASGELTQSTEHIRTVLSQMREVTQEELEQFRMAYQESLEDFFAKQNNLLEDTLGRQRDALQEAVTALREAMRQSTEEQRDLIDSMEATIASVIESMSEVEAFAERLGLTTGSRVEELREMTEDLTRVAHAFASESRKVREDLEASHQLSQDNLRKYIDRTEASQHQFFEMADEAISELGGKLLDITEGVDYAAETLVSAVEHRQNGNGQHHA